MRRIVVVDPALSNESNTREQMMGRLFTHMRREYLEGITDFVGLDTWNFFREPHSWINRNPIANLRVNLQH